MKKLKFREPEYLEQYQYVSINLDTPLTFPNVVHPQKTGPYYFSIDNTNETYPFDWYNAFLKVDFQVQLLADGNAIPDDANTSTANFIYSFFKKNSFDFNKVTLNTSSDINRCCYIKNLLNFSKPYENVASNHFDYPDANRTKEIALAGNNLDQITAGLVTPGTKLSGYLQRHQQIIGLRSVQAILSLNRYGFFESLEYQICHQGKVKITIELETHNNIIYRDAGAARVFILQMVLYVPKLIFNEDGRQLFLNNYLAPHSWNFFEEQFYQEGPTDALQGTWLISSSISKPRDVIVWAINANRLDNQEHNKFFHDTFDIAGDHRNLSSCQLEVGNGNFYPSETLYPFNDLALTYRLRMAFNTSYNDHLTGSQLSLETFKNLYGVVYFNIRNQRANLRVGTTKLTLKWRLNAVPNAQ